jgi:hypothetical protein
MGLGYQFRRGRPLRADLERAVAGAGHGRTVLFLGFRDTDEPPVSMSETVMTYRRRRPRLAGAGPARALSLCPPGVPATNATGSVAVIWPAHETTPGYPMRAQP